MPLRSPTARIAVLFACLLFAAPVRAAVYVDAAGRRVTVPDQIERIMPAGPASAVFVYALVPDKLIGWTGPLRARSAGPAAGEVRAAAGDRADRRPEPDGDGL